jgi:hypothetical protein
MFLGFFDASGKKIPTSQRQGVILVKGHRAGPKPDIQNPDKTGGCALSLRCVILLPVIMLRYIKIIFSLYKT